MLEIVRQITECREAGSSRPVKEQSFTADRAALHKVFQINESKWYCSCIAVVQRDMEETLLGKQLYKTKY